MLKSFFLFRGVRAEGGVVETGDATRDETRTRTDGPTTKGPRDEWMDRPGRRCASFYGALLRGVVEVSRRASWALASLMRNNADQIFLALFWNTKLFSDSLSLRRRAHRGERVVQSDRTAASPPLVPSSPKCRRLLRP